jgi:hypothetical protein
VTHLSGRILDAKGNPVRNALVGNLAVRRQGRLPPHRRLRPQGARQELPGLRAVPDRLVRRILLPHHQAGPLPRPHPAHPLQDQEGRQGTAHYPVLRQGRAGQQPRLHLPRRP